MSLAKAPPNAQLVLLVSSTLPKVQRTSQCVRNVLLEALLVRKEVLHALCAPQVLLE